MAEVEYGFEFTYNIDFEHRKCYNIGYLINKAFVKCTFKIRGYEKFLVYICHFGHKILCLEWHV